MSFWASVSGTRPRAVSSFLQEFRRSPSLGAATPRARYWWTTGVKGIPEKFFIDAQGRVARKFRPGPHPGTRISCATFWTRCWPPPAEKPGHAQKGRPPKSELRILNPTRRLGPVHIRPNRFPKTGTDSANWIGCPVSGGISPTQYVFHSGITAPGR